MDVLPAYDPVLLPVPALVAGAVAACVLLVVAYRLGAWVGHRRRLRLAREGSRRALAGQVAEQWAPFADGFPGHPSDARFLGAPVDYVVFDGLSEGALREIVLVEVKSGRSSLSRGERQVRDAVHEGRVRFVELRVDAPRRSREG